MKKLVDLSKGILEYKLMNKQIRSLDLGECVCCSVTIFLSDFRDRLSFKEFTNSQMCQDCQDEAFVEPRLDDREEEFEEMFV